jgi:hypothetical protein
MNITRMITALVLAALLGGCASSSVIVGKVRPPISPAQVKIYLNPPPKFEEIALLETSSRASWSITDQGKMDTMMDRMKEEAAKLGANGILLRGTADRSSGGISTGSFTGNLALGVTLGMSHKVGSGTAIYVEGE